MTDCVKTYVEWPIILLFFAFTLSDPVTQNLTIYRTCYLTLGYNDSDCALLGKNYSDNVTKDLEKKVQPYANEISMTQNLIQAFIPPVLCFFLGPWSDKYGRKPLMLSVLGGYTISFIISSIIAFLPQVSPWYILLGSIPVCLSGGFPILLSVMICYITDVTSVENRGMRMGFFEGAISLGLLLGTFSCSFVFDSLGYVMVYAICTGCVFLSWLYVCLLIPESIANQEPNGGFCKLFDLSLLERTFSTTFKRREHYDRGLLFCMLMALVVYIAAITADGGVMNSYLREKFHWSLEHYTLYSTAQSSMGIVGSLLGIVILHKLLHFKETVLMIIGFLSLGTGAIILGLASTDWMVYLGGSCRILGGMVGPMVRSLLSKQVPKEETGQVFALITAVESMLAFGNVALYTVIYNATMAKKPGFYNFISAGCYAFEIIITIVLIVLRRMKPHVAYNTLNSDVLATT